jgi:hypothetical protein
LAIAASFFVADIQGDDEEVKNDYDNNHFSCLTTISTLILLRPEIATTFIIFVTAFHHSTHKP